MANTETIEDGTINSTRGNRQNNEVGNSKLWVVPGGFDFGNQKIYISNIFINDKLFTPGDFGGGIELRKNNVLKFKGGGLNNYSSATFLTANRSGVLRSVLKSPRSNNASFVLTIPGFPTDQRLWIELVSRNSALNRTISPFIDYLAKSKEEEK